MSQANQRLSSGLRINRASDDAAGLSIAGTLRADAHVYSQAIKNANDGISAVNIAESSLQQLSTIVTRQRELAEQAANGVYSTKQRLALHQEANALASEYNRIVQSTSFNGRQLLDSTFQDVQLQIGYGSETLTADIGDYFGRNLGTGTFTITQTISTWAGTTPNRFADLNGDERADLIHTVSSGIFVHLANSDGSFGPTITSAGGGASTGYENYLDDVNGDGNADIITVDPYNATYRASIHLGQGDGTFTLASTIGGMQDARLIYFGDIDGDNKRDIIAVNQLQNKIDIQRGNGDGTFGSVITTISTSMPLSAAIADLNEDGKDDLIIGNADGGVRVHLALGGGQFAAPSSYSGQSANGGMDVAAGDFNGDGHVDIYSVVPSQNAAVHFGLGDGTLGAAVIYSTTSTQDGEADAVDYNGDGILDIVQTTVGTLNIRLGNTDGTFGAENINNFGTNGGVGYGDFNGDGVYDAVAEQFGTDYRMYLSGTTRTATMKRLDLTTAKSARSALDSLKQVQQSIQLEIGSLGAFQSRSESAISALAVAGTEFESARSRIEDVDIAEETAQRTRAAILQQASVSVLAQANRSPTLALQLLRGF